MEAVVALHRYYIWANRMREHFDAAARELDVASSTPGAAIFADDAGLFLSYWYAGLYVVIEGWKDLGLSDPSVDPLLSSPNVELLRRYRNGVSHFQKTYFDPRFSDLLSGSGVVPWVRDLNLAFGRYFLSTLTTGALT